MSTEAHCAICQTEIGAGEETRVCPACAAPYHDECWRENGGCAVYGCPETPPTEKLEDLEIPQAYWGQERKPCPKCGADILAGALRCRHCGARFASERPEDSAEYRKRQRAESKRPDLQKRIVWIFVFSIVPVAAAVAGLIALGTLLKNRDAVRGLPAVYGALLRLAILIGLGQSAFLILVLVLYGGGS